ncbi:hypothetical protein FRC20_009566 [Serendipita sp. 405]|nr:hypothetical protein FRC20_009566 [Serendipita sp. 405]
MSHSSTSRLQATKQQGFTRGSNDFLHTLPTELSLRIIREAVIHDGEQTSIDGLLVLTLVSPRWRISLLSSPELWSYATVGRESTEGDAMAKLETCLALSQDAPLTLNLCGLLLNWEDYRQRIQPHTWRIARVIMKLTDAEAPSRYQLDSQKSALNSLGFLPSLHDIQFDPVSDHRWLMPLIGNVPSLEAINSVCNIDQLPLYKYLFTTVHMRTNIGSIQTSLPILQASRSRRLSIEIEHNMQQNAVDSKIGPSNLPFTLSFVRILQLQEVGFIKKTILFDLIAYFPSLVSLTVNLTSGRLVSLLSVLSSLAGLQMVYLGLELDLDQPLHTLESVSPSRATFLNLHVRSHLYSLDINEEMDAMVSYFQTVTFLLQIAMPFVNTLTLGNSGQATPNLLESLPNWRSIRKFCLYMNDLSPKHKISSNSLEEVEISNIHFIDKTVSARPEVQIECPNLLRLQLRHISDDLPHHNSGAHGLALPLNAYAFNPLSHSIEISFHPEVGSHSLLSLNTALSPWIFGNFPHLRRVSFSRYMLDWDRFFIPLIQYPHMCPNLDHIEFRTYPPWDLLFLMLERRNLSAPTRISPIKTLIFPYSLPFVLLYPLSQLLGGRETIRPSNYDLSVIGMKEVYMDPFISGCQICLCSFQQCHEAVIRDKAARYSNSMTENLGDIGKGPVELDAKPPLSDGVCIWLSERRIREVEWQNAARIWSNTYYRKVICENRRKTGRCIVTEYSLDGVPTVTLN